VSPLSLGIPEINVAEKDLETSLVAALRSAESDRVVLSNITISSTTSDAKTLAELCRGTSFDVIQDDSRWNLQPKAMPEIIGNTIPDIVIRSKVSMQNRIYIEVKESSQLNYGRHDSQVIRYFLHLLVSSERNPGGKKDIRRALLLAAPNAWFDASTGLAWRYFMTQYSDLARAFDITLGEIRLD
jgi:hypothetical protein